METLKNFLKTDKTSLCTRVSRAGGRGGRGSSARRGAARRAGSTCGQAAVSERRRAARLATANSHQRTCGASAAAGSLGTRFRHFCLDCTLPTRQMNQS